MEKRQPKRRFKDFQSRGDWEEKKLGEMEFIISDGNYGELYPKSYEILTNGIPFVRANNIKNGYLIKKNLAYISPKLHAILTSGHLEKDDILITTRGEIGKIGIVDESFIGANINAQICLIRTGKSMDSVYLHQYLQTDCSYRQILSLQTGSALKQLPRKKLSELKVPIPPLEEQKKLGDFFQRLDRLIDLNRSRLDKLRKTKEAYLVELFPREGESYPRRRFPGFTGPWEEKKLGDVARFGKGIGYSKKDLRKEGIPIILYGSLYTNYKTNIKRVDTFAKPKNKTIYSIGGEVIIPSSGETAEDIARASVVNTKGIILGGDLNIIYLNDEINSVFLALLISYGYINIELIKKAQGKSVVHLYNTDIKDLNILYPSLEEQKKIGDFFQRLDGLIAKEEERLDKLENLKKAYLNELFV